jgi:hypothetical protein
MIVNYDRKTFMVQATGETIMGSKPVQQRKKIRQKIKEKPDSFVQWKHSGHKWLEKS